MLKIYTGSVASGKSLRLIQKAEMLNLQEKRYKIFYPKSCSNGKKDMIASRNGVSQHAIEIDFPVDIFNHICDTNVILLDEAQFMAKNAYEIDELIMLVKHCEKCNIDIYVAMLDLDFRNTPFPAFEKLAAYADEIQKLPSICVMCKCDNARISMRMRDGKPCCRHEDILIERSDDSVEYKVVCRKCYDYAYKL